MPELHQQTHGKSVGGLGEDISYSAGPWLLGDNEALIIEGTFPPCIYASVVLWNRFLQSLDYRAGHPVSLNRKQLRLTADGTYKIILEHTNPGTQYDWLSTEGRTRGTIMFRFVLASEQISAPRCTVVPLSNLLETL